jgi:hypothetical protein
MPNFGNKRKGMESSSSKEEEEEGSKNSVDPEMMKKQQALLVLKKEKQDKVNEAAEEARSKVEASGDIQFTMLQVLDKQTNGKSANNSFKTPAPGSKVNRMKSLLARAEEKEKKIEFLKTVRHSECFDIEIDLAF